MQYYQIFQQVALKLKDTLHLFDQQLYEDYLRICKHLPPQNDYTFTQIMMEYIADFNVKGISFYKKQKFYPGFFTKCVNDQLIITDVVDDLQFVIGDQIVMMSHDKITELSQRYRKHLYELKADRQDWSFIIQKQQDIKVLRGDETYHFELNQYVYPDARLNKNEQLKVQQLTIYDMDHMDFDTIVEIEQMPIILDLRHAFGSKPVDQVLLNKINEISKMHPIYMIQSQFTKGTAELLIQHCLQMQNVFSIGQPTFGNNVLFTHFTFDQFHLELPLNEGHSIEPKIKLEALNENEDECLINIYQRLQTS